MGPAAETREQAGSGKVGAEEVWEVDAVLLSLNQGTSWVFVLGEGTGWWEALTPTGPGLGLSARQLPCSMLQPW